MRSMMSSQADATQPLVSVIIPTFNREDVIANAIESALVQTYKNLEVIVIDDGSTDNTESKLACLREKIRYVKQGNRGPSAARNRGIQIARGEILAFLDSDDLWSANKIQRQVAVLEKAGNDVPCCLCNATLRADRSHDTESFAVAEIVPPVEEGLWLNPEEIFATRFVFFNQAVAVRKWALDSVGGFDESLWFLEDWDLALRLSVLGPWGFIRQPLATWNPNGTESLVTKANRDPVALKQAAVQVHQRALQIAVRQSSKLRKLHSAKLKSTRRELAALRMGRNARPVAASVSRVLQVAEHCRTALLKRTPLFPKMKVALISDHRAVAQAC
jgi:hypothetical protein